MLPFVVRVAGAILLILTALQTTTALSLAAEPFAGLPSRDYWPTEGWRESSPEANGMDDALLAAVDERLQIDAPLLSSIVVVHDGKIAFERYYGGYPADQPLHTWSVSKSVTNIAVGIALEEGVIGGLDQTLGELIPGRIPADADPRVTQITVEQLLTMTAGWAWDGRINFSRTAETDDLDSMLLRPLQCDPGACFEYDSGASNVLSYIIQAQTGQLMADYLQPRLFDPLGIDSPGWIVTEDGANRGGGGLYLTPREMAKIGFLYLNQGRWDDRQIVSAEWVARSTSPQASGAGYLSGVNIGIGPYGYHWWTGQTAGGPAYSAMGFGGQLIYVVPGLDLVVATAYGEADGTRPDLQQHPRPAIEELIIPAALAG